MIQKGYYKSPLGWLEIECEDHKLQRVEYMDKDPGSGSKDDLILETKSQLKEYFRGARQEFNLPLNPQGTNFQLKVWEELRKIPAGKTTTYLQVAKNTGDAGALRAVGTANGKNPLPIIIPCHRVIGQDGNLIGYAGGLWRKKWLLRHEGYIKQIPLFAESEI